MSLSNEQILDAISNMSVLDLSELIKAMEEKFGVSAAMPAMAMPMAGGDAGAAEAAVEEQTEFSVMLTGFGDKKVGVIKVVRAATGLGLIESKALVEGVPSAIKEGIGKEEAEQIKADVEAAGGTVEIK